MTKSKNIPTRPVRLLPSDSDKGSLSTSCRAPDDSLPTPRSDVVSETRLEILSSDYQLTSRTKITLDRRQQSLLLDVLNYQAVHYGVTFASYLFIEMLYSNLVGSKSHPVEVKDEHERRVSFVAHIILQSLSSGDWILLGSDLIPLVETVRSRLLREDCLMSSHTYDSRCRHWRPEVFLEVRVVRLDVFCERSSGTRRYSSYCKGYGESHRTLHKKKTRPSFELDGSLTEVKESFLLNLSQLLHLNLTEQLRKLERQT